MRRFWKITKWCGIGIAALLLLTIFAALVGCLTARLWQKPWVQPMPNISLVPKLPVIHEADVKPDSAYAQLRDAMKMVVSDREILGDSKERAEAIIAAAHDTGEINDPLATALHREVEEIAKMMKEQSNSDWQSIVRYDISFDEESRLGFTRYSDDQFPLSTFLLIKNRAPLAAIWKIAESLQPPEMAVSETPNIEKIENFQKAMSTVKLIRLSAKREASIGDFVGAFNQLNAALKMTSTMTTGKELVGKLVEYATTQSVLSTIRELTELYDVPPSLLQDETSWLATWRTEQPYHLAEALKMENVFSKDATHKLFSGLSPALEKGNLVWEKSSVGSPDWLETHLSRLMGYSEETVVSDRETEIQNMIVLIQKPYERQKLADWDARFNVGRSILMRDPLSYYYMKTREESFPRVYYSDLSYRFSIAATRVMLAIRAFKQTERKLPESLDALVPKYLPAVPRDPFLESVPLHFRANADGTWIVYSVGADQVDDGGSEPKDGKYRPSLTAKGDLVLHSDEAARSKAAYEKRYPAATR